MGECVVDVKREGWLGDHSLVFRLRAWTNQTDVTGRFGMSWLGCSWLVGHPGYFGAMHALGCSGVGLHGLGLALEWGWRGCSVFG